MTSLSYKTDLNEQVSLAVIWDQPFGASIKCDTPAAANILGGTTAQMSSNAVTALARYKFDGVSVFMAVFALKLLAET